MPQNTERDRMPYMQIAPDQWIVIRESKEQPKALIQMVTARDQTARYLLYTWNPDPAKRRLHGMYDTIEEANREVKWNNPKPNIPGIPDQLRQPNPNGQSAQARHREAAAPPTP